MPRKKPARPARAFTGYAVTVYGDRPGITLYAELPAAVAVATDARANGIHADVYATTLTPMHGLNEGGECHDVDAIG